MPTPAVAPGEFTSVLPADLSPRDAGRLRVGIDTVQVSGVDASLNAFGERFVARLFSAHEAATCGATPARRVERLAARFAAKEAAIKAFDWAEAGIDWRQIEVRSDAAGRPTLALHGRAAALAQRLGAAEIALSLSHDGDNACAIVVALFAESAAPENLS